MLLSLLLEGIDIKDVYGEFNIEISDVIYDSRKCVLGCVFVCITGKELDGHKYMYDAIKKGAAAVIVEKGISEIEEQTDVTMIQVDNSRKALALMSANFFGNPSKELTTIGITGTKGKTTTSYMIKTILDHSGIKTGLIGTIETIIGEKTEKAENTTPESYEIQRKLRDMVRDGCKCVVMEVSSQGLMLSRVEGIFFDYGLFTNLSPDHIGKNEHKDLADYISCKSLLFQQSRRGILNKDDDFYEDILKNHTCDIETFGMIKECDLKARKVTLWKDSTHLGVAFEVNGTCNWNIKVGLPGDFTVYNAMAAISVVKHFQVDEKVVSDALEHVKVKGRVEFVPISNDFILLIDYAHNAMSLESLLTTLREYRPKRLVCLFGCGGNRAKARRYEMGEVSGKYADYTVITSDNPRFEEPDAIILDILQGIQKGNGRYVAIPNRIEAIKFCIQKAKKGDIIVLAGKGHEDYQEIKGIKYPMDEREIISDIVKNVKR